MHHMTVDEFYKAFDLLLREIDEYPKDLSEIRRDIGLALTRDKNRRIYEKGHAITHCIMEESDLNKLVMVPTIDAITCKKELIAGRLYVSAKKMRPFICDKCWVKYNVDGIVDAKKQAVIDKERKYQEAKKERDNQRDAMIIEYIKSDGKKGYATPSQAFYFVQSNLNNEVCERLKNMPYKDFLNTVYWKALRRYVLHKSDYSCNLCSTKQRLHVHHRHYRNRGREIYTWKDDLIVLCSTCHAKQHDKLAPNAEH